MINDPRTPAGDPGEDEPADRPNEDQGEGQEDQADAEEATGEHARRQGQAPRDRQITHPRRNR